MAEGRVAQAPAEISCCVEDRQSTQLSLLNGGVVELSEASSNLGDAAEDSISLQVCTLKGRRNFALTLQVMQILPALLQLFEGLVEADDVFVKANGVRVCHLVVVG